jgi:hypothetical protein
MKEASGSAATRPCIVLAMIPGWASLFARNTWRARHGDASETEPAVPFESERAPATCSRGRDPAHRLGLPPALRRQCSTAPEPPPDRTLPGTVKEMVTPACFERGIRVITAAEANAIPVVEYTLAAILLANKHAFEIREIYRRERRYGLWHHTTPGIGNLNKRVGIVGASRIGRRLIEALRPFDFSLCVYDPYLSEEEAARLGVEKAELDALLRGPTVTPALTSEIRQMISARSSA